MKRDMDLIRQLLIEMESRSCGRQSVALEGRTEEEVSYHVKLLAEAGLIEAANASTRAGLNWIPVSLTWDGHEFLDAARDDTRWNSAKATVKEKAGAVTFEVLKQVLVSLVRRAVGL